MGDTDIAATSPSPSTSTPTPTTTENNVTPSQPIIPNEKEVVEKLAQGLTGSFSVGIEQINSKLEELTQSQQDMISLLQSESKKLSTLPDIEFITQTFAQVNGYMVAIQQLQKDMHNLSERMTRLKKKAAGLSQRKTVAETNLAIQREKMLLHEQQLIAKPSKTLLSQAESPPTSPPSAQKTATVPVIAPAPAKIDG
eukprot:TRINITY_DN1097_c0_g1_i2.p1 TRINITY_DN1097_c0_g1~~TRINITY_DN1097_c0_g1_i2.p1  ORF type:complete len:197 (-),score=50.14 TRINITY_DN1097_c0_g1_i2:212-802(-)